VVASRRLPVTARRLTRASALTASALAALACGSCSSTAELRPGPSAELEECLVALEQAPATVLDAPRTPLDVAGAVSWGSPAVVLRCGLGEIGPTTATCLEVDGVDWVLDTDADPMTATSYGRAPAVELRVPAEYGLEALPVALVDVGPVARALPTTGRACLG
jgi:hypothetical protein